MKMKKYFYMAVAAVAAFSSCTGENASEEMKADEKAEVFTATIQGETRTTLGEGSDDSHKKVLWSLDDQISVNGVAYKATSGGQTKSEFEKAGDVAAEKTGSYQAYYPAEMNNGGTISLPASYTYAEGKFNMPMYALSTTTDLVFQNICGVLAIKVTSAEMAEVTKITVTSDKAISGACDIIIATDGKHAAKATGTADADKTVTLDCGASVTPTAEGTTFYLPIPVISGAKLYISVSGTISDAKKAEYKNLIYRQAMNISNVSVTRNNIYNIDFKTSLAKFSVSATKKVNFTKSNLRWDGSALKFEEKQYHYPKVWNASYVGHFYWRKSRVYSYAKSSSYEDINSIKDTPFFSESNNQGELTVEDTSDLYVLSKDEWIYLLGTGTVNADTGNGKSYKIGVTVAGNSHCCIIVPDGYMGTLESSYTEDEWTTAEANGLVCLPPAGYRDGSQAGEAFCVMHIRGCYWSATLDESNIGNAYSFVFGSKSNPTKEGEGDVIWIPYRHNRSCGSSIRLVKTFSKN